MPAKRTDLRRDHRLLEQSYNALGRVSDWLNDLATTRIDGRDLDDLGRLRNAVAEAEREIADELES